MAVILAKIGARSVRLTQKQHENLRRFENKLPKDAKPTILKNGKNGQKIFRADVPAKNIKGSFARYEKTVDANGHTIKYTKTTFDADGNIIHIKRKF